MVIRRCQKEPNTNAGVSTDYPAVQLLALPDSCANAANADWC